MIMDKPVSKTTGRRSLAGEGLLPALVDRLTERGIIRPEEAEDMLALLTAFSDDAHPDEDRTRDPASRRQSPGLSKPGSPSATRGSSASPNGIRRPW